MVADDRANTPSNHGLLGLALSGGGSRAIAFHLGCLCALHDLGVLDQVRVLSSISGGSVIGGYYAYTPEKPFAEFEADIRRFLQTGLESDIALELLKPHHLLPCVGSFFLAQGQELLRAVSHGRWQPAIPRYRSRTDMFQRVLENKVFPGIRMDSPRRSNLEVVIGACELRLGEAFRFGTQRSGGWRHGAMVDGNVPVSFAVAASAAYPIFLPAFDRTWDFIKDGTPTRHRVLLTDGGIYDNLGVQALEPGRDPRYSLHNFPCDRLIVCNAGHGQEYGRNIPMGFVSRVEGSFGIVHRRVQEATMNRLHAMKEHGQIRGFAMPYLGQMDDKLPMTIPNLISRDQVVGYPTNFAAMKADNIAKLAGRGEQLTRALVRHYLPELLEASRRP